MLKPFSRTEQPEGQLVLLKAKKCGRKGESGSRRGSLRFLSTMSPRTLVSKPAAAYIIQNGQKTANAASAGVHTPHTPHRLLLLPKEVDLAPK